MSDASKRDSIKPSSDIARLIEIMAALRTPGTGCPWDLEQTFATIAPYTLEEAYEVADAIARGDLADLKDELGDLLLQVVYHARMGEEAGAFAFSDVVESITGKMIRRHPHVFGDATARAAADVKVLWERIKAEEKAGKASDDHGADKGSLLSDIPLAVPALVRAAKLQDKAANVGFDWPSLGPVFEKLREELREFEEAALPHDPRGKSHPAAVDHRAKVGPDAATTRAAIEEELGDILFVLANVARHLEIDPEAALRGANRKFIRRFAHIEVRLAEAGKTPAQSTLDEMDALWDEAKSRER